MRSLTAIVLAALCILVLTVSVDARRSRKLQRRPNSDESANNEDGEQLAVIEEENPTSSGKRPKAKENHANSDQALSVPATENKETGEKSQTSSEPSTEENQKKDNTNRLHGPLTQLFRRRSTRKPLHFHHNKKQPRPTLPSFLSRSRSKTSAPSNSSPDEETSTNNYETAEPKSSRHQRPQVEDSKDTGRRINRRRFSRRRQQTKKQDGSE
ncbi:cyclin-L1-like [Limulus polyphemus]|uniref:Cyclin-L1-like n=1 Tax=Limulus polyphemus TaxID=6850 RepID=A0ABM1SAZ2_LIMPO|nr:cyclin-L1-like [Limulus polyphemus]